jgi:hypothetical protein
MKTPKNWGFLDVFCNGPELVAEKYNAGCKNGTDFETFLSVYFINPLLFCQQHQWQGFVNHYSFCMFLLRILQLNPVVLLKFLKKLDFRIM